MRSLVFAGIVVLAIALAGGAAHAGDDRTPIRVSLLRHQFQMVISSEGGLIVTPRDDPRGHPFVSPDVTTVLDIRPANGGLLLAGAIAAGSAIVVEPVSQAYPISVNGHRYRGGAIVQAAADASLDVVDVVDLETYLYSVVGSEMDPSWPQAALEAQAIVARTYAVAHLGTRDWLGYDLRAGEQDQAYGGMQSESPAVVAAVDATRGTVLVAGDQLVHAYYSSCDGGYTSGGEALGDPQPYLVAVPDPYCTRSPDEQWTTSVSLTAFSAAFRKRFGDIGAITDIVAGAADASGRLETVIVVGSHVRQTVPATVFRSLAGWHAVRSTRIASIAVDHGTMRVHGSGFGHGVGMSQWGARGMADAGKTVRQILAFYYPGSAFASIADHIGRN